jgi:hypothetical protein
MEFPIFQTREWITQFTDPNRKPAEPKPPRRANMRQLFKYLKWTRDEQHREAQKTGGFPQPTETRTEQDSRGNAHPVDFVYDLDKIDQWRERVALLINARLK